jgi:pimeloyl-ACP methyl ester carboxylesterase
MAEVAGLSPDQVALLRSMPAWEARLAVSCRTRFRERSARTGLMPFDPGRFRDVRVPTLFLLGGDSAEPFRAAAEAVQAALPDCRTAVMPGQRHAAMDTATELFNSEVLSFLEPR